MEQNLYSDIHRDLMSDPQMSLWGNPMTHLYKPVVATTTGAATPKQVSSKPCSFQLLLC